MRIEDALTQVRVLQVQVTRTERYYCYRWATVAATGCIAVGAVGIQAGLISDPVQSTVQYLLFWVSVAAINAAIVGAEILARWLTLDSEYARRQTLSALRQFLPCLLVGALVTGAIQFFCPEHGVLFPALWSVLFSLGLFSSTQHLPAGGVGLASYYLAAGLVCLRWGHGEQALQPWTMLITFGVGQFWTAFVLYRQLEKFDEVA